MDITTNTLFTHHAALPRSRSVCVMLVTLLLGAGAVHAAGTQETTTERPLNLSLPSDAKVLHEWRRTQDLEYLNKKPYGSGYEARGLGGAKRSGTDSLIIPSSPAAGSATSGGGRAGGSGAGGGGGGGSGGGAGGRGR